MRWHPAALTARIRKIHDFLAVGAPALLLHETYYRALASDYDKKRRILYDGLRRAGFKCQLPEGAYYIFTDMSGFGMDDLGFARYLVEKIRVAAVPGSSSYHAGGETRLLFTFSKKDETLHAACERLERLKVK